jgi:hypothetical protein
MRLMVGFSPTHPLTPSPPLRHTTPKEQKQECHSREKARPQVRPVQRARREARPQPIVGGEAEEEREESQGGEADKRPSGERRLAHSLSRPRERTKETTALARSGGTSRGFKSFRVRPVAS